MNRLLFILALICVAQAHAKQPSLYERVMGRYRARKAGLQQKAKAKDETWFGMPRSAASAKPTTYPIPGNPFVNSIGMRFVWVPIQTVRYDNDRCFVKYPGGLTCCKVPLKIYRRISSGYWVGAYEVTQAEYRTIMGTNPSKFLDPLRPVERVTHNEAKLFCSLLSERERMKGILGKDFDYSLPSTLEWQLVHDVGVAPLLSRTTKKKETDPVGRRAPSALGVFDIHGNVSEWTFGELVRGYFTGEGYNAEGGSYLYPRCCRGAVVRPFIPESTTRESDVGFRVVLVPSKGGGR